MNKPYISVVTPVLNAGPTLRRTLEAMAIQQASFEHVVCDGGSTDGSRSTVEEYKHVYPVRLIDSCSEGMYLSIAQACESTSGEVMAWINADDFYLPYTLAMVEKIFRARPDVDWISGVPSRHWEGENLWSVQGYVPLYIQLLIRAGWYRWNRLGALQQESLFWRRSLYERSCAAEVLRSYKYAADFHLWRRFACYAKLHTVRAVFAAFTIRDGQISARNRVAYDRECGVMPSSISLRFLGQMFNRFYANIRFKSAIYPEDFTTQRK